MNGFENHGIAKFDTRLGAGVDSYLATASDIYVAAGASFAIQVDGEAGRDLILANVQATVDGDFSLVARGGAGADTIGIVLDVRPVVRADRNESPLSDPRPAIDVLIEGNDGDEKPVASACRLIWAHTIRPLPTAAVGRSLSLFVVTCSTAVRSPS